MVQDDAARQRLTDAVSKGMYELDDAARGLGIRLEEIRPGYARLAMRVRDDMLNSHRICHGGMVFCLADTAFAYASNSQNRATVALSCAITFTAAAQSGEELAAIAEERVRHSRTGIYDIVVTGRDGRTIALFRGNSYEVGGESVPGLNARLGRS